ncbi:hypothetical protein F933_01417 [Acinetobacter beijerinckii CIP 110307]|uniref:Uncharacterized protein n=1 Tax=Acinetobacter beijerinckii CIP 110307 TaxID=1217648 RepID=N9E9P6_9GAMM|nr:hypothetical protein F933_01417 [Acinetobacter beijerinckii CIP 110307]
MKLFIPDIKLRDEILSENIKIKILWYLGWVVELGLI